MPPKSNLDNRAPDTRPAYIRADEPGRSKLFLVFACAAFFLICVAYANHFQNSFHFDDAHTIVNNVFIRDLHNIPQFFTDARTFSSLPANQTWRPIVSASLALDYRLGHGLQPLWFHISTFFWFLILLALTFMLFRSVLDAAVPGPGNLYVALFATTWYGLHPAIAETVNYIIQRADLYSTLGAVAGMVMYIRLPHLRKFGLYLLPVAVGAMAKAPAVVFCGILMVYIFLFEENANWNRFGAAMLRSIPAIVVCVVFAVLNVKMVPKTYVPATMPSQMYWATQPYVILRYFRSFFFPLWLSADTDLAPFSAFSDPRSVMGIVFCAALLAVAFWTIKRRQHRPISFGIFWFFGALAPTSLFVLSEAENDHRMFFPFVGLMLSVTWTAFLLVSRWMKREPAERRKNAIVAIQAVTVCVLLAYAFGTWKRNEVWRTEESLWKDVTIKSPENGRGWMNYGLTKMERGDFTGALADYQRGAIYAPNYFFLEINTGIVLGAMGRHQEAEPHFRRAIELQPMEAQTYYFYARWLNGQGRTPEAVQNAKAAIDRNPAFFDARYLLMEIYAQQGQWAALRDLAQDTLRLAQGDIRARSYLDRSNNVASQVTAAAALAQAQPTPEHYLNLSLLYHQTGKYQECIDAARKALNLRPNYPEAYNNIAAAYEAMSMWDPAIEAAQQALRLEPDYQLAKNNLAWSLSQKKLQHHQ
jgi:tetratricopeptide (TPR) repeat protein